MKRETRLLLTLTIVAAIAMTLLRAFLSGYLGLGDDEAYYWDWSRRLQLSYYDHPGMTAWMIRLGTAIFGQDSFGVRFFGQLSNVVIGLFLFQLARRMFSITTAAIAVLFYLFAPIYCLGGLLMVPDAPMGMMWMAVLFLAYRIFCEDENRWETWLTAGALLGLGIISKYTIILLAGSIVLLMLTERSWRRELRGPRFWSAVVLAVVFSLPIIIWNTDLGWPTLKYHLHDRQTGGGGANFTRWAQFWATQAVALGPALLLAGLWVWVVGIRRFQDRRWRFILVLSLPTFALFCAQALFAEFKPHWPAPSYSLLLIGAAELVREGFGFSSPRGRALARWTVVGLSALLFIPLNIVFHAGAVWPIVPKIARAIAPQVPWDPKFDPTNDLYGWEQAARRAKGIREEFKVRGEPEPFFSSSRYQLVAQLAFATQDTVYRVSPGQDQYSFWQTPQVMERLVGRPAVYITDSRFERDPRNDHVFASCEEQAPENVMRGNELARSFHIWVCRGFLGLR